MSRLSSLKPDFEVHFDGPDYRYGNLRKLLIRLVTGTPAGGSIDWVTYYFRDRELASALIDARQRGVDVRLTLSGKPRTSFANDVVIGMLRGADVTLHHKTDPFQTWGFCPMVAPDLPGGNQRAGALPGADPAAASSLIAGTGNSAFQILPSPRVNCPVSMRAMG